MRMWRFLLAGLSTIGGVALLLLASFSDSATTWWDARTDAAVTEARTDVAVTEAPTSGDTEPAKTMSTVAVPADDGGTVRQAALEADEVAPTVPAARIVTPPVYHGPVSYALPWQPAIEPVRHLRPRSPSPAPVRFFAALRRDVSALFRPTPR
jgi:hypothetical protein